MIVDFGATRNNCSQDLGDSGALTQAYCCSGRGVSRLDIDIGNGLWQEMTGLRFGTEDFCYVLVVWNCWIFVFNGTGLEYVLSCTWQPLKLGIRIEQLPDGLRGTLVLSRSWHLTMGNVGRQRLQKRHVTGIIWDSSLSEPTLNRPK